MGVKCTHYKLCSVQSKLVYFSQFWGMKHLYDLVVFLFCFVFCFCFFIISVNTCISEWVFAHLEGCGQIVNKKKGSHLTSC